ncbi:hypothetical protein Cgig2_031517 [Carnegiea gigantea]|uniref:Uncharacterized protein n=1 Tax=Carnegiea gigantea TaxID=171969 RepID=A0A9Q1QCM7_9CARY|nr:hypothetical protein Cgig2_031517 [Carnegiea gigantea]
MNACAVAEPGSPDSTGGGGDEVRDTGIRTMQSRKPRYYIRHRGELLHWQFIYSAASVKLTWTQCSSAHHSDSAGYHTTSTAALWPPVSPPPVDKSPLSTLTLVLSHFEAARCRRHSTVQFRHCKVKNCKRNSPLFTQGQKQSMTVLDHLRHPKESCSHANYNLKTSCKVENQITD